MPATIVQTMNGRNVAVLTIWTVRVAVLALAGPSPSWADEWAAPRTREVWSESREYFVRVVPGKGIGETVGFRGAPTGPHAPAELYRRESDRSYRPVWMITLVNPVAPIDLFVTDRGYLVTLDNCTTWATEPSPRSTPRPGT